MQQTTEKNNGGLIRQLGLFDTTM
ncbi:uncharacterized protein METZ01_LOCUS339078, partial [marine metagenome]